MLNEVLTLTWKDKRKGKPRILTHGTRWLVLGVNETVLFSDKPGPWLKIQSLHSRDIRWIHQTDDENFKIV